MFAFGLLAFARGWLGGGDVKLMTAIAAWTGITGLPLLFIAVSVAGGGLALVYAVGRRLVRQSRCRGRRQTTIALRRRHCRRDDVVGVGDRRPSGMTAGR